jgi:hypothetical protein
MGGGGASAPAAPAFRPVDILGTTNLSRLWDTRSYMASDQRRQATTPQAPAGIKQEIADTQTNLAGGDRVVDAAEKQAGLGDINLGNTQTKRSINYGQPILARDQRTRNQFEAESTQFPDTALRQIGPSSSDIVNSYLTNTNNQNNYNQGIFGSRVNAYNSAVAQSAANNQGYAGLVSSGAGDIGSILSHFGTGGSNYLSTSAYGPTYNSNYNYVPGYSDNAAFAGG